MFLIQKIKLFFLVSMRKLVVSHSTVFHFPFGGGTIECFRPAVLPFGTFLGLGPERSFLFLSEMSRSVPAEKARKGSSRGGSSEDSDE